MTIIRRGKAQSGLQKVNKSHRTYNRKLPREKNNDVREMEKFDNLRDKKIERDTRIELMERSLTGKLIPDGYVKPTRRLLGKLRDCEGRNDPCHSLACPVCMRRRRIDFVDSFSSFYDARSYRGIAFVTLLAEKWFVGDKVGDDLGLPSIKLDLKYQMKVAGFTKKNVIIGFIDAEQVEDKRRVDFHIHLLIPFRKKKFINSRLKILRKRFYIQKIDGVTPAMHHYIRHFSKLDLQQKLKIISYLWKPYWGRTNSFLRNTENKHRRIKEPLHSMLLVLQDMHKPSDLRFVQGARIKSDGTIKKHSTPH